MNLLIVVSNYPHAGHPSSGAFNERSARALQELGHRVEVLAPRPYVPRSLAACHPRWRAYDQIVEHETRHGMGIYRPAYVQLPGMGCVLRPDRCAYLSCARRLAERHKAEPYDAILAFNLIGAGGLAWRLARRLAIPAAGWATGNDVRVPANSTHGRAVRAALRRLDLKFYQSAELLEQAAALCGVPQQVFSTKRHVVLPRGIELPPAPAPDARRSLRAELGVRPDQLMVLFVGRIVKAKGVFELIDAISLARRERGEIVCVLVGAHAGFDDSAELIEHLRGAPEVARYVHLLPACAPAAVWQYFNAADVFAFPSHREGMPNSLLEAMAAGLPALAYAIAPVLEIDNRLDALKLVPPGNVDKLARSLVELARNPEQRRCIAATGKARVLGHYHVQRSMAEAARRLHALAERAANVAPFSSAAPILSARGARSGLSGESQ
ncbi:MAG: glycosyltransferase [Candidatus Binatia bacterium]